MIRAAAERLRAAGIDNPRHDAQLLMIEAFGDTRAALITAALAVVPAEVRARFEASVVRREAREPLQHILGWTGFYGLELKTDARALIPRPDSECAVEVALALVPEKGRLGIADLGTGSGCLLAALLANLQDAEGTGVEADPAAASLARENFALCGLEARASVFEGRWSDWTGWKTADLIISNPPYIPTHVIESLEPEVKDFDPAAALDGGADGLAAYREIIRLGGTYLKRRVPLVLEIGHDQRAAVLALLGAAGFTEMGHRLDLGGNDRCVWGLAPGRAN
jgi:release factor glutamine methyltransferase